MVNEPSPQTKNGWSATIQSLAVNLFLAGAVGFVSSYISQQASQRELQFRLSAAEAKSVELASQTAQVAKAAEENARKADAQQIRYEYLIGQFNDIKMEHDALVRQRLTGK